MKKVAIAVMMFTFLAGAALADDCGNGKDKGKGSPSCGGGGNPGGGSGGGTTTTTSNSVANSTATSSSSSVASSVSSSAANQTQQQSQQVTATGGNATAQGGNASASGGSVSGSGNSHNTNTNSAQGGQGGAGGNSTMSYSSYYRASAETAFGYAAPPTANCALTYGAGGQLVGGGLSLTGSRIDANCQLLEAARSAAQFANRLTYCKVFVVTKAAKKAHVSLDDCLHVDAPAPALMRPMNESVPPSAVSQQVTPVILPVQVPIKIEPTSIPLQVITPVPTAAAAEKRASKKELRPAGSGCATKQQ